MKQYMSSVERTQVTAILAVAGVIEEFLEKTGKHLGKDEHKFLKTACTYLNKYMPEIFKRVGIKEAERIADNLKTHELKLETKMVYQREWNEYKQKVEISREDFYNWSEAVLDTYCNKCKKMGVDMDNCKLREVFFMNDLPKFDESPGAYCQYRINLVDKPKKPKKKHRSHGDENEV